MRDLNLNLIHVNAGPCGNAGSHDRNVDDYDRKCGTLMNVFDNGGQGDVISTYANPGTVTTSSATWKFDGGKLVGLQMIVFGDYEQLRDDLTTTTGVKPHELVIPYHNGFGATWNDESPIGSRVTYT